MKVKTDKEKILVDLLNDIIQISSILMSLVLAEYIYIVASAAEKRLRMATANTSTTDMQMSACDKYCCCTYI